MKFLKKQMDKLDIVYYMGVLILTSGVIAIMYFRFREYDEIDIKEHIVIITIYIVLLVLAIILWRLLFDMLNGIEDKLNIDNSKYERMLNG